MQFKLCRSAMVLTGLVLLSVTAQAASDTAPPVLTAFNVPETIDLGPTGSTLSASFKASDDLSGVKQLQATAYGPGGQIAVYFVSNAPSTKISGTMHSNGHKPFLTPGVYTYKSVDITDFAGNKRSLDAAELAALGRVSFTLKNDRGYDTVAPSLVRGTILTPVVSLSSHVPGTDLYPVASMKLTAKDAGNNVVSGVRWASVVFCKLNVPERCIYVSNDNIEEEPLVSSATLKLGGSVSPNDYVQGEYHIHSLTLFDFAENHSTMISVNSGGDTDFSSYFPSTTITLVP